MFKNRSIRIKLVKEGSDDAVLGSESANYTALVNAITSGALAVIFVYMGLDTCRKIIIHTVATKIR